MSIIKRKALDIYYNPSSSTLTEDDVQGAIDELDTAIVAENLFDRDTTGSPFITQHTPGDDLLLKDSGGNQTLFHDTSAGTTESGRPDEAGVMEASDSTGTVQERLNSVGDNYHKGLYEPGGSQALADDAEITVSSGKAGWGFVNIGDNQEYAFFDFSTTTVHLIVNSANVVTTDTDTNLCIYYSGANLKIKNRLGSQLTVRYRINHS